MNLSDLLEAEGKQLVIIYPGRFHPFHIGHGKVYKYLKQKYSNAKVFIATSGKVDGDRSPFTFDEKKKMMMLAGVDASAIVQTKSPYQSIEIMERFDKDTTVMVFAVSEKDMAEDPRFDFSNGLKLKKNGGPAYLQKWTNLNDAETFGTRGYIATTPTFPFEVLGQKINSASQIRNMISKSDDTKLTQLLQDLYSVTDVPQDVIELFKNKIGNTETMNENWDEHSFSEYLKENVIEDNIMKDTILQALTEGKSPHKKGTKKYKDHMAAIHAESIEEEFDRKVKEVIESREKHTGDNDQQSKLEYIHMALSASKDGDLTFDEMTAEQALEYVKQIKVERAEDKKKLSYISTTLSASIDEDSYFDEQMADQALEYVEDIIERPLDEAALNENVKPIEGDFDWANSMTDGTLKNLRHAMDNDWDVLKGIKDLADFKRTIDIFFTNEETPVPEDIAKIFNKLLARDEKNIAKFNEFIRRAFVDAGEELEELDTMFEHTDHEVSMARKDVSRLAKYSSELEQMLSNVSEEEGLQGWVQAKITKAADYISSVKHYMEGDTTEVNEAGGYYTQPVYDMIKQHGYPKVMHRLLSALDADVIQDFISRESDLNEKVEEASGLDTSGDYANVYYDYSESFYMIDVYKDGKKVEEYDDYIGAMEEGNPIKDKFLELVKKAGLEPEGLNLISTGGDEPDEYGVFKNGKFNWDKNSEVTEDTIDVTPAGYGPDDYDEKDVAPEAHNGDLEKMQDTYKYNEDRNNHSENILMLAQAFGDRGEIRAVEGLLKIIKRQGYTTPEQSDMMYKAIHKKYYSQLFPETEAEGNKFSGELKKAKIDGKKSFDVDGKTYKVKEALSKLIDQQKI
jgi:glycerol-3-phosphate cytidylyltransferase-like family protein